MKRIPCSDWLPERARWAHVARSALPTLVPQKRNAFGLIFWPYNKSFIDQACSVKMAGYWPRSYFKKELGQYPVILTEQAWSITQIYYEQENFSCKNEKNQSSFFPFANAVNVMLKFTITI